ncbi:CRISPR-associated endonuclease Cas3'' [Pelagicoccus sp. NFK12]|uniref:CRISPR-associated endonuclease Cas3 n=1 Tax=Pelagicoccus enzymogenes TaxID=2773457 RepID=A0A927F5Z2_9BACT|nr:CRISPR-associated endonuclease Cas3'' [Pelagicoccus enzymogenes]MBD5779019.1 CRISPR-associated endonuclease Cas3'' [Pelagicoccus enzymogenes]
MAYLAGRFAEEMFSAGSEEAKAAREWGRLAGFWHDLGKFAPKWQVYLRKKVGDAHEDECIGTVDHSTAGGQWAAKQDGLWGHLLAYGIVGHHSGLLDVVSNGTSCQEARLSKTVEDYSNAPEELLERRSGAPPEFVLDAIRQGKEGAYVASFFSRMLFSCLVDADFLATESFMNAAQAGGRNAVEGNCLEAINRLVAERIASFGEPASNDIVNQQRAKVVADCVEKARAPAGLFTLTVPTGGGKTLSSLRFALQHALRNRQKRIIYVVPFSSIIEQNAEVIRSIVAPLQTESFTPLVEHHSSLSPEKETEQSRLAAENWDASIVITTSVQFFESLHGAKTSRCRKLHNIANAVVILDEAQTLPVSFLEPCLKSLQELSDHYNTTTVLCTATQPAIGYNEEEFPIGLKGCREIIEDPKALFDALKRVEVEQLGMCSDKHLAERMGSSEQVLCIVNRRKHAQEIFRKLNGSGGAFHLSALMCPEHRSQILALVRKCLDKGEPVRLVSTQLIEAGVDVDFPVVYRSLAGLDSVAQAAGRCNRNGKLKGADGVPCLGKVFVFEAEEQAAESYFRETAQVAAQVLDMHDDLLGEKAIHHYFDLYYYQQKSRWDEKEVVKSFRLEGRRKDCPFRFKFRSVAECFKLIDDWQTTVIIPFDESAEALIGQLRNESIPIHRNLLRRLQRFTVQVPPKWVRENSGSFEELRDGQFLVLISPQLNYSKDFGITFDEEHGGAQLLNI